MASIIVAVPPYRASIERLSDAVAESQDSMAGLMDMEELLAMISNPAVIGYMREAVTCYSASAYRGCIVLSYIALFDDMRAKLAQLSTINKTARTVYADVEKRANDQDVFETFMADKLKKENFLTTAEHDQLNIIRQIRNRAAHPSGVIAIAEEARYVFRAVIGGFLSKPLLKTTQAVDALVERLEGSNFFPTSDINDIAAISEQSLEGMHSEAYPYLLNKLVGIVKDDEEQPSSNAQRLLIGLARSGDDQLLSLLRSIALVKMSHDNGLAKMVGRLVAANPQLLTGLKVEDVIRVRALLEVNVAGNSLPNKLSHSAKQLAAMLKALGEDAVFTNYESFAKLVSAKFPFHDDLLEAAKASPKLVAELVAVWKTKAKSSTFTTANAFAEALPDIDDSANLIKGIDALRILAGVVSAAEMGAFAASSARSNKFAQAPKLRKAAIHYITSKSKTATTAIDKILTGSTAKTFLEDELTED